MPRTALPFCLALVAGLVAPGLPAAAQLACRFGTFCYEGGMCGETDRSARLEPTAAPGAALHLETGTVAGAMQDFGAARLFDGGSEQLRLLLAIDRDGMARMIAVEASPLRVALYFGSCEEL
jgi:hypothetical protein